MSYILTKEEAYKRGDVISDVNYDVLVRFDDQSYQVISQVKFTLSKIDGDINIESNAKFMSALINSQKAENSGTNCFTLSQSLLKEGVNTLQFHTENVYSKDSCGMHKMVDTDNRVYIYSFFTANYCNRLFPCFDQPDLKGKLTLHVLAPKDWVVLGNEQDIYKGNYDKTKVTFQVQEDLNKENYLLTCFKTTPPLSTYLLSVVAGEYQTFTSEKYQNKCYCRQSLGKYMQNWYEFILECTEQVIDFYEKFFQFKFPFNRADSVFVPEFNYGAVEHVGIIDYNDKYIFQSDCTVPQLTDLVNVISHEISHQWFGNLVTTKWWDDIWLNESFADFISYYCLEHITLSKRIQNVKSAYHFRKLWAYVKDQKNSTHSVVSKVANTNAVMSIFDGITYSKGSSCIAQLLRVIGRDNFSNGLKNYFNKYQFKNATLDDFMQTFQEQVKDCNLTQWKEQFLVCPGLNFVSTNFSDGKQDITIQQECTLPQFPTLRRHVIQIALFTEDCKFDVIEFVIENAQSQLSLTKKYKAILLNHNDHAFLKVNLDSTSLEFFKKNLFKIDSPIVKQQVWHWIAEMVSAGQLSSDEYIDIFLNQIPLETDYDLVDDQIKLINRVSQYTPQTYRSLLEQKLFTFFYNQLFENGKLNENLPKNLQISYKQAIITYGTSYYCLSKLLNVYNNKLITFSPVQA